jgi:hypothetical protein
MLIADGMDIKTAQDRMGHEKVSTTLDLCAAALPSKRPRGGGADRLDIGAPGATAEEPVEHVGVTVKSFIVTSLIPGAAKYANPMWRLSAIISVQETVGAWCRQKASKP